MYTFIVGMMVVSYQLGVKSIVDCFMFQLLVLPVHVNNISLLIIAADNTLASSFPYKYKHIIKHRVVAVIVVGLWLIAAVPTAFGIAVGGDDIVGVPEYGLCAHLPQLRPSPRWSHHSRISSHDIPQCTPSQTGYWGT